MRCIYWARVKIVFGHGNVANWVRQHTSGGNTGRWSVGMRSDCGTERCLDCASYDGAFCRCEGGYSEIFV